MSMLDVQKDRENAMVNSINFIVFLKTVTIVLTFKLKNQYNIIFKFQIYIYYILVSLLLKHSNSE